MTLTTAAPLNTVAPTVTLPPPPPFHMASNSPAVSSNAPVAQVPASAPSAVPDTAALADAFAASADPGGELAALVTAVAARSRTAAQQGLTLATVEAACKQTLKQIRAALLAAVADTAHPGGRPGVYDGFTVATKAGSRSLSYTDLEENYPDVYAEMVSVGKPSIVLTYTG
ncbi:MULTISPECIES: hypothetical protein [Mycolicibacterium]|jgi:hypothetical protein|uniref:Uncharacterized protein n=1 Tax=Mycolicibacterium canariasense TaxID=228230 RepID=A0A100WC09_MYCCR|nr:MULTISPECIES: hypothetical protein [Mycolicibacterium]MCC9184576.1 hypothetical protein [Mycolicibacterium mageritense]GAS95722.1 uncharacterized protein RMCC_2688 [Mycolicibacterium canariasense]